MATNKLLEEIRETNLAYLMLAQTMIRQDRVQALFRLGISAEVADIINGLTAGQLLKIAGTNQPRQGRSSQACARRDPDVGATGGGCLI
jgi:hypothetical protein